MSYIEKNISRVHEREIINILQDRSHDLEPDLEPLYDRIGDSSIVMLGEASHGTHEYYLWRARITKHLIENKGFTIVGVEGDWPDCYRINRYIRNYQDSGDSAFEVLRKFNRWPTWMWANWETAALMDYLKEHNNSIKHSQQVGFYGLDVYSLWESLEAIQEYLRKNDPEALKLAEQAMQCFEPYDSEGTEYASATRFVPETCEEEVIDLLKKIRSRMALYDSDPEGPFNAEQNAMTAVNAERYYRAMVAGGPESWNIRDEHMTDTLERLLDFHGPGAKAIVWEHNTHIGDARATDMHRSGMVNVGQLARDRWGTEDTVLVGFGSYKGSVIAGDAWGARMREMQVPPAREFSWEEILHSTFSGDELIITRDLTDFPIFSNRIDHRAIGVVYHPERERFGNYVPSVITERYDAFIFIDETRALHPIKSEADQDKVPETFPWAF